jgi:MFS family permease
MTEPAAAPRSNLSALAILFGVVFINLVGFGLIVPLLPFFGSSLGADPWQITLLFAAYSLGQFFAEPFWGRLSDRIGRKPVLLITLIANAAGYLILAFVPDIWTAIAVRAFTGLGAGNISTVQGYVADVTPPEQRAGRMGMIGAAFGLGFIVGPGVGGLLVDEAAGRQGFLAPIYLAAIMAAVAAVGVVAFLKESRARADPTAPREPFLSGLKVAFDNPVVSRVLVVTLIFMAGFAGMESTFALWADQAWDWHAREVGLNFMAVGVVSVVSQGLLTGRLARRFGEANVLAFGAVLFGVSLVAQVVAARLFPGHDWVVPVITALTAFGMSLTMPNVSALISRSVDPDRQGQMLGLNMASGSIARILGPIIAGVIYSALGPSWPFLIGALFAIPAAIMALNAGRAFAREQTRRPAAES